MYLVIYLCMCLYIHCLHFGKVRAKGVILMHHHCGHARSELVRFGKPVLVYCYYAKGL